jgi:hypothetical protein
MPDRKTESLQKSMRSLQHARMLEMTLMTIKNTMARALAIRAK